MSPAVPMGLSGAAVRRPVPDGPQPGGRSARWHDADVTPACVSSA